MGNLGNPRDIVVGSVDVKNIKKVEPMSFKCEPNQYLGAILDFGLAQ